MKNYAPLEFSKREIQKIIDVNEKLTDVKKMFDDAFDEGYQQGLADCTEDCAECDRVRKEGMDLAWNALRKLYSALTDKELSKLFNDNNVGRIMKEHSVSEVIDKIEEYESISPYKEGVVINFKDCSTCYLIIKITEETYECISDDFEIHHIDKNHISNYTVSDDHKDISKFEEVFQKRAQKIWMHDGSGSCYCSGCGTLNNGKSKFCSDCGAKLINYLKKEEK